MSSLTLDFNQAPTFEVVAIASPAQPNWLDLPALHARLLPLAQAAGHEKLHLNVEVGDDLPWYRAKATGGVADFRRYIGRFEHGDTASQFERRLTELLQKQAQERNEKENTSHAA